MMQPEDLNEGDKIVDEDTGVTLTVVDTGAGDEWKVNNSADDRPHGAWMDRETLKQGLEKSTSRVVRAEGNEE